MKFKSIQEEDIRSHWDDSHVCLKYKTKVIFWNTCHKREVGNL